MFGGPSKSQLTALLLERDTTIAELRARVAQLSAHFDWLASHVNELKIERAALLDRVIDIKLAGVAMIQRDPVAPLTGADPGYVPTGAGDGKIPNLGDILQRARDLVDDAKRPGAGRDTVASADLSAISFEDMGDEAARAQGITHGPDGKVVYAE